VHNPCLAAVLSELELNGTVRLVVVSRTRNARGEVRRLLRLDGLITGRNDDEPWCERP
jgi:hypothetical protein